MTAAPGDHLHTCGKESSCTYGDITQTRSDIVAYNYMSYIITWWPATVDNGVEWVNRSSTRDEGKCSSYQTQIRSQVPEL